MSFDPLDPARYPLAGERIGPAWKSALETFTTLNKTDPELWIGQHTIVEQMVAAGPIRSKTAENIILQAVKCGFLAKRTVAPHTQRQRAAHELRLNPEWKSGQ